MSIAPKGTKEKSPTVESNAKASRPHIMNRGLFLVFASSFGANISFYLLLSVVPLYATSVGAGGIGAGLTTGALMFSTVATELATPRLVARFGYRLVFGAGLVLLGAPLFVLTAWSDIYAVLTVSIIRGIGFAIIVVVGSALVASFAPQERRGEGLGLYGVTVGIPAIAALPLGVWLTSEIGYQPLFIAGALVALIGLPAVIRLPGKEPKPEEEAVGVLAGLRTPALLRPSLIFSATTMAAGVVVTFLPLAITQGSGDIAALALLVQAAVSTLIRWWAGLYSDRHGSAGLLLPGLLASATGMLALVMIDSPFAVIGGMVIFGAGFGVCQNASLALMFDRVSASGYGAASALWNLAYDGGLGLGATGFGLLAAQTGYPIGFAVTTAIMLLALVPALRDRIHLEPRST